MNKEEFNQLFSQLTQEQQIAILVEWQNLLNDHNSTKKIKAISA